MGDGVSPEAFDLILSIQLLLMNHSEKPFDFVLSDLQNQPVPHLTFAEYIRLEGLAPGNYTITATLHGEGVHDALELGDVIAMGSAEFSIDAQDEQIIELPEIMLTAGQGTDRDPRLE